MSMSGKIKLKRPGMGVGDTKELDAGFDLPAFDLYGRHHEVERAEAFVRVTRLAEGLHLDVEVRVEVSTTCDRTLEPTSVALAFGESEFLSGPNDAELYVEDWEFDVGRFTEEALPSEIPMQVFCSGTRPVEPEPDDGKRDPRWSGLDDLFASGF
jgi:uncharacterized protein